MQSSAEMEFVFKSDADLKAALKALKHEEDFKKRTNSKITGDGKKLIIKMEASDSISLRAAINAYLRDIQVMEQTDTIEK